LDYRVVVSFINFTMATIRLPSQTLIFSSFFLSLLGYNGLPSIMSGLDDSLSDVGAKKKYPFELEKAIHNVMFIQHHMQRQDEFNAVSGTKHFIQLFALAMYAI
jgi:nicotinic acetylcholine receptor, invertebrate